MSAANFSRLILASASPRRRQLLRQIGYEPDCCPVDVDESPLPEEPPLSLVLRLAQLKAHAFLEQLTPSSGRDEHLAVIGADTVIDLDGHILGKPSGREHCLHMLKQLANREHSVVTGVCVLVAHCAEPATVLKQQTIAPRTQVRFGPVSLAEAQRYWDSGEPCDKAGGYAIQGGGARFVASLSGSYSNVKGLPLYETHRLLQSIGLPADRDHITDSAYMG